MMCSFNNSFVEPCPLFTTLMTGSETEGVHVELYVRSLAPRGIHPRQRAVIDTLGHLSERGIVDDHLIHVCGDQVPASRAEAVTAFGQFLLDRIAVFREWADRNDWSLDPGFGRREVDSSLTGHHIDVLTVPVMALAEYEGDDLRFVAPVSCDDTTWTIQDRLDALRARGTPDSADHLTDARTEPPHSPALVQ